MQNHGGALVWREFIQSAHEIAQIAGCLRVADALSRRLGPLPLEFRCGDPKCGPIDPWERIADRLGMLDGSGERLSHGFLRQVSTAASEAVETPPQPGSGVPKQLLIVINL